MIPNFYTIKSVNQIRSNKGGFKMNQKAAALFNIDQKEAAVKLLVQAIDAQPDDLDNYLQLGTYLTELKDFEQAEELLQKACHRFPNNGDLNYDLGIVYYEAEHFELALQQFTQLIKTQPKSENFLMLARIYFKQQNYPKAAAFALTAHEKAPDTAAPSILLGDSLLSMGQLQSAKDFYLQAHKVDPDNLDALFGAGMVTFILDKDDRLLLQVKTKNAAYYDKQQQRLSEIEKFLRTK